MKWSKLFVLLSLVVMVLAGCGSATNFDQSTFGPDVDMLAGVQRAVNEYREDTGVLPIKTRDQDTDIFIKYLIDFDKLVPKYIGSPPANSYEKGGIFQYMIWDPEENPTVKLVDLRTPERIREINIRFSGTKYPQFKDKVVEHVYTINYKNIGYKQDVTVQSPYSNTQLPLVVTSEGDLYVDYSIDLNNYMKENDITATPGDDIREILIDAYPIVPAYSLPYTVDENNEPVIMYDPINKEK
ncbi:hypothetical protein DCE79_06015 [Lysinibacillus sp. 2017]|uniref:hypothetical protein n=1 Tax=unclassified Lysinibacillus TaxID=2636778 RepID=UPI000D529C50|nr:MULTISPECIES: hypothetical protein [unclassified Lysinibacillus]AWE06982.1 hypothetical protein DCE79_06015 [Lysinibacillus sp. 2017]TGN37094.1 hypothetical protein E4L99_00995 [Lysinibacillus sp. S2017]